MQGGYYRQVEAYYSLGQVTLLPVENTLAETTSSPVAGQQHNVRQGEILHYYYLFIYPPEQSSC